MQMWDNKMRPHTVQITQTAGLERRKTMSVTIKPWGRSSSEGYDWNGRILRSWAGSSANDWEWDGKYLHPWGRSSSEGWEADGPVPIPVWALILGLI
jgi:hypothetical protein